MVSPSRAHLWGLRLAVSREESNPGACSFPTTAASPTPRTSAPTAWSRWSTPRARRTISSWSVILSPALNSALALCQANGIGEPGCPWDSLSKRADLDGLSNEFEDLFLLTADQVTVPRPGSLMLVGAGLIGLGVLAWRRRRRA